MRNMIPRESDIPQPNEKITYLTRVTSAMALSKNSLLLADAMLAIGIEMDADSSVSTSVSDEFESVALSWVLRITSSIGSFGIQYPRNAALSI